MIAAAIFLASLADPSPSLVGALKLVRTEETRVSFSLRSRGSAALVTTVDREQLERLPARSIDEFVLRGAAEVNADGWNRAMVRFAGDPAGKIGLAHAMNTAASHARDPFFFRVPAQSLPKGTYQDTDYGLRAYDLNVPNGGEPIRLARYWLPEPEPLHTGPLIASGYRLPDGTERAWAYRGGGWQQVVGDDRFESFGAPIGLRVDRTGIDLNNVRYTIRNQTDDAISGFVLPGQVLHPDDPAIQRMVTIARAAFTVPPGGVLPLDVPVACLDMHKKEPTTGVRFRESASVDPVLANLVNITANSPFLGPWDQARLWIHTDAATFEQINDRLGIGVSPQMYQRAAAEVAMHGGLDPFDPRNEPVLRSLADPRTMLMGMQDSAGLTSLFGPNLNSPLGSLLLAEGARKIPGLLEGRSLSEAQLDSLAKTCGSMLWSGDAELELAGLSIVETLRAGHAEFASRPEVQAGIGFARHSPDGTIRTQAWNPDPVPAGSFGTLVDLRLSLKAAEDALGSLCLPSVWEAPEAPRGFSIQFGEVPVAIRQGDDLAIAIQASSGTPVSTSIGYRSSPTSPTENVASVAGSVNTSWRPEVQGPTVLQLRASSVSGDGQIFSTSVPVHHSGSGVLLDLRSDLGDALRRSRDARGRESRARTEAERRRLECERIASSLRSHLRDLEELRCADRDLIDGLEGRYRVPIGDLLDRNKALAGGAPPAQADIDQAAEDAQKAVDECDRELEELRRQKADAEKRRDQLHDDIQGILDEVDGIYRGAGFTGGNGFHGSGQGWFGYVREGGGLPPEQSRQVSALQSRLRSLNRQMNSTQRQIAELDAKIKAKEKECADLERRNREAQQAKANRDAIAANNAQIGQAWDDISQKLRDLQERLGDVEGGSGLADEAGRLGSSMPTDQNGWDRFWERLRSLVERKRQLEETLEKKVQEERERARRASEARDRAEDDAERARDEGDAAASEAGTLQDELNKQPPATGTPDPSRPPSSYRNPCMEKFAAWLKKYQDKMDASQLETLNEMMKGLAEKAQVPGVAVGEAIAGGARALAKGAGSAAVGMNALASGFLSLGAGLFYAYAQSEIASALGPLGSKIRLARVAALLAGSNDPCGEVGAGGVTGAGSESFFYFRVRGKLIVFRGGESGIEFVGVGDAM